jgi:NADH:ubiquinone oxidoreductase subunit 2 (subunit N)
VNFYSPTGMSDLTVNDLTGNKKVEELAFQEFVMKQHIQNNSDERLWYLPLILIQLTLTFLSFGIYKLRRHFFYKKWQLPTHFAICLILTTIGLGFILSFDNLFFSIFTGLLILTINYWTLKLLTRQRNEKSYA